MQYIVSWSGGKDSTASIILAHEHNIRIDEIIFCEVMYDRKRNISGENPQHIDFIKNKAIPLFEEWGYKVTVLHAEKDYLECFNTIIEHPRKHMRHKGKKRGFPCIGGLCYVKRDLKLKPIKEYLKGKDITQYIGIASDEPKRLEAMKKQGDISLLERYGYTEPMAMQLCEQYGLLSPTYANSKRGGCWFCPNAKLTEHAYMLNNMQDIWEEFVSLEKVENIANPYWNRYSKELLKDREKRATNINNQQVLF